MRYCVIEIDERFYFKAYESALWYCDLVDGVLLFVDEDDNEYVI